MTTAQRKKELDRKITTFIWAIICMVLIGYLAYTYLFTTMDFIA